MRNIETKLFSFDPSDIHNSVLQEIAEGICVGKCVIFPTETVYGLGALHTHTDTLKYICEIKGRGISKPLAFYIHSIDQLSGFDFVYPHYFIEFTDTFWPGPITLLLKAKDGETHGIRFPDQTITIKLLRMLPTLLKGTSANISGEDCLTKPQAIYKQFEGKVDYIVDGGVSKYGNESTVIDITTDPSVIVRKGIMWEKVKEYFAIKNIKYEMKKRVLVVCTGNTCRSPMVGGILINAFTKMRLNNVIDVDSCGVYSPFSIAPSQYAIDVLRDEGIDISWHRSKSITKKLLQEADKIIVMTKEHEHIIRNINNTYTAKIRILNINDPIGRGLKFYKETFSNIKIKLEEMIEWIQK